MKKIFPGALVATLLLTACLKDKGLDNGDYGLKDPQASPVGVGFPQAANSVNVTGIELQTSAQTINVALVNLLSDEPAAEDIHVTLQVDQSLVAAYNTDNPSTALEVLDQADYSIAAATVVIPKGSRTATLALTIPDASVLDASKRYGIGFTIASVGEQSVRIADNMKDVLFAITVRNAYEASYEIVVDLTGHPSASGHYEETGTFATIDANTVDAPLAVAEIFAAASRLAIRINGDNTLTLSSNATTINPTDPTKNYYDPATQTFHFDYTWGAGPRHIIGTARRL